MLHRNRFRSILRERPTPLVSAITYVNLRHSNGPLELFYAYSREDEEFRDQLETHLTIMERQGVIKSWHDRRIGAGREWKGVIDDHLNSASVILLLISADFLASEYCYDVEMTRAMQRMEKGELLVVPVMLRHVEGWETTPFGKLQAVPKDARPVKSWADRDEAFADVAKRIRAAIEEFLANPTCARRL